MSLKILNLKTTMPIKHQPTLTPYRLRVCESRCGSDSMRVNPRFARYSQA